MTIGGGRVLDAHPLPKLRRAEALQWLIKFKDAPPEEKLYARIARRDVDGLTLQQLSRETGLTSEALETPLYPLIQSRRVLRLSAGVLLVSTAQQAARERVDALLQAEGRDLATKGWKRSELRSRTRLSPEVFDSVMKALSGENRIKISGELVFRRIPRLHLRMQIGSGSLRSSQSMRQLHSGPPCRPRWQTVCPSRTPRCGDW